MASTQLGRKADDAALKALRREVAALSKAVAGCDATQTTFGSKLRTLEASVGTTLPAGGAAELGGNALYAASDSCEDVDVGSSCAHLTVRNGKSRLQYMMHLAPLSA